MIRSWKGKTAVITGASSGIGASLAKYLSQLGIHVFLTARREERLRDLQAKITANGGAASIFPGDLSCDKARTLLFEEICNEAKEINLLINNAGIATSKPVALVPGLEVPGWTGKRSNQDEQLSLQEWRRIIDTNLTSAFLFAQVVGPHMMKQRKGKVINTSSTCADEGLPRISAYSVSKAGLSTFTRCLASEWGPFNINVNAIAPGVIRTDMVAHHLEDPESKEAILGHIPLGRVAEPRDVALLVLFLASEASDYITGQILTVDGGSMGRGIGI